MEYRKQAVTNQAVCSTYAMEQQIVADENIGLKVCEQCQFV